MKEHSLHQIMNSMAQGLGGIAAPAPKNVPPAAPLSELEAFIQMDSLLCSLNKDYLDAKAQRIELVALYGNEDAMVEVVRDMEDSAWCAMQTRYIEVRSERELMERAQMLMRRALEKVEMEKEREKAYEAQQLAYYLQTIQRAKEKNKNPNIFEWIILLLIFKMEPFHDRQNLSMRPQGLAA